MQGKLTYSILLAQSCVLLSQLQLSKSQYVSNKNYYRQRILCYFKTELFSARLIAILVSNPSLSLCFIY